MKPTRYVKVLVLMIFMSLSAFADVDPVSFCASVPPPSTICSADPNLVGSSSFVMVKNGSTASSSDPWYLLVAVPNNVGGAPTITSDGGTFALLTTTDWGQFLPTTGGDIYGFAGGLIGDNSMNAANMFGAAEQIAFGGTPLFFEIYSYKFTPSFIGAFTSYSFSVGGSGLVGGTFLAAAGGSNPFSTPFTTTGLVTPDGGVTVMLLGGALIGLESLRRRFRV